MQIAHILKAACIQVQYVSLSAAWQKSTLNIISRRMCMHAPSPIPSPQSSIAAEFSKNMFTEGVMRICSWPFWRTGTEQNNNFCIIVYVLHDIEQAWMDYFETVVTRSGTAGARPSVPSYLCSSVSRMRLGWSENTREVFWLNNSVIAALMLSVEFLGSLWLWLTFTLTLKTKAQ